MTGNLDVRYVVVATTCFVLAATKVARCFVYAHGRQSLPRDPLAYCACLADTSYDDQLLSVIVVVPSRDALVLCEIVAPIEDPGLVNTVVSR